MIHVSFVAVDGALFTFGERDSGKLGLTTEKLANHRVPQQVTGISDRVVQVACGGGHTVALTGKRPCFASTCNLLILSYWRRRNAGVFCSCVVMQSTSCIHSDWVSLANSVTAHSYLSRGYQEWLSILGGAE